MPAMHQSHQMTESPALQLEVRATLPWLTQLLHAALQSSHLSFSPKEERDNAERWALALQLGRGEWWNSDS